ncbi:MAG TPA: hypothetical protein VH352_17690 [Pseudonocardiaceae bacterium]|jgi:hypothetical protein|nr:hypothetical protein [Pseudonocardiaceae bacterium]
MTSANKIVVAAVAVSTIVLIVLGASLRWLTSITILAFLVCCAVGALVSLALSRGDRRPVPMPRQTIVLPPPPVPDPQQVAQSVVVEGVNLASAWPDYEFTFHAIIYWRSAGGPVTPHVRPGALAIDTIIRRAAQVAADETPDMVIRLQHRLNDVLGVIEVDRSGRIEAWADQVHTTLPEADASRLRTLSTIRKDKAVWEHERRYECDKRQYLTEDVLKSTGSALVWWLSRNESNIIGAVDLIGMMARLTAAAKDEDVPELFRHLLPPSVLRAAEAEQSRFATIGSDGTGQLSTLDFELLDGSRSAVGLVTALMGALDLDDEQRAQFAARVATDIEATGDAESAEQVRRRFDVITEQFAVDEESEIASEHEEDAASTFSGHPESGTSPPETEAADD